MVGLKKRMSKDLSVDSLPINPLEWKQGFSRGYGISQIHYETWYGELTEHSRPRGLVSLFWCVFAATLSCAWPAASMFAWRRPWGNTLWKGHGAQWPWVNWDFILLTPYSILHCLELTMHRHEWNWIFSQSHCYSIKRHTQAWGE